MKRAWTVPLLSMALAALPAAGQTGLTAEVHDALSAFAKAFNARDAKGAAAAFDEKAVMVSARGDEVRGRDAIEKNLTEAFAGPFKEARIALSAEHLQQVTPDVSVQSDLFYLAGRTDAQGKEAPILLSHYMAVWVKRGASWKIAAFQAMVPRKD